MTETAGDNAFRFGGDPQPAPASHPQPSAPKPPAPPQSDTGFSSARYNPPSYPAAGYQVAADSAVEPPSYSEAVQAKEHELASQQQPGVIGWAVDGQDEKADLSARN